MFYVKVMFPFLDMAEVEGNSPDPQVKTKGKLIANS